MVLTTEEATIVTSLFVVAALGWAAFLSVGAAAREARWASRQLSRAEIGIAGFGAVGVAALVWVEPGWLGIGLGYIAGVLWVMSRWVRKTLRRADALGGAAITPAARKLLLLNTSRWMWVGAAGLSLVTAIDWLWRGLPAVADGVLTAVFAIAAWRAGKQADKLG